MLRPPAAIVCFWLCAITVSAVVLRKIKKQEEDQQNWETHASTFANCSRHSDEDCGARFAKEMQALIRRSAEERRTAAEHAGQAQKLSISAQAKEEEVKKLTAKVEATRLAETHYMDEVQKRAQLSSQLQDLNYFAEDSRRSAIEAHGLALDLATKAQAEDDRTKAAIAQAEGLAKQEEDQRSGMDSMLIKARLIDLDHLVQTLEEEAGTLHENADEKGAKAEQFTEAAAAADEEARRDHAEVQSLNQSIETGEGALNKLKKDGQMAEKQAVTAMHDAAEMRTRQRAEEAEAVRLATEADAEEAQAKAMEAKLTADKAAMVRAQEERRAAAEAEVEARRKAAAEARSKAAVEAAEAKRVAKEAQAKMHRDAATAETKRKMREEDEAEEKRFAATEAKKQRDAAAAEAKRKTEEEAEAKKQREEAKKFAEESKAKKQREAATVETAQAKAEAKEKRVAAAETKGGETAKTSGKKQAAAHKAAKAEAEAVAKTGRTRAGAESNKAVEKKSDAEHTQTAEAEEEEAGAAEDGAADEEAEDGDMGADGTQKDTDAKDADGNSTGVSDAELEAEADVDIESVSNVTEDTSR